MQLFQRISSWRWQPALWFATFEASLALLGVIIIWLVDGSWHKLAFRFGEPALWHLLWFLPAPLLLAVLATAPMADRLLPLREIRRLILDSPFGEFIRRGSLWSFFSISLLAGIGEEILFRACLQNYWGLLPAALLFGLCHALSMTFFLFTFAMGLYLGWVYAFSGNNLVIPIVIHALYDFLALWLYRRQTAGVPRLLLPEAVLHSRLPGFIKAYGKH